MELNEREKRVVKLAERLGLGDPYERIVSRGFARGCGKTTKILLDALCELEEGRTVFLIAHSDTYAKDLELKLRGWCRDIGVENPTIKPMSKDRAEDERTFQGIKGDRYRWFNDHYDPAWEALLRHAAASRARKDGAGAVQQKLPVPTRVPGRLPE